MVVVVVVVVGNDGRDRIARADGAADSVVAISVCVVSISLYDVWNTNTDGPRQGTYV